MRVLPTRSARLRCLVSVLAIIAPVAARANRQDTPGGEHRPSAGEEIVASVGNRNIYKRDIERHWQIEDPAGFARVQRQVHENEARALDALIADRLLEQEAERRHVPIEVLLKEASEPVETPTEVEIRDVFERSAASTKGASLEVAAPMIASYLKHQKEVEARRRYVDMLRRSASLEIRLPLESWRQTIAIAPDDPHTGPDAAPIEIVEFSDFECPYCRRATPVLKQVLARYRNQVRLVWKDFPLPMHQAARPAAEAAQCANEQGKFWAYHDVLFRNQDALTRADFSRYAGEVGLDIPAFNQCLDGERYKDRVSEGIRQAANLGVSATPTVFINGRMITGAVPVEAYEDAIQMELSNFQSPGLTR
jgi:protein-disulfide isomerase